jgi:hypothetical protein
MVLNFQVFWNLQLRLQLSLNLYWKSIKFQGALGLSESVPVLVASVGGTFQSAQLLY